MQVSPDTMIRVQAIAKGVYNGAEGTIIVCDPEGHHPNARFPRIKAKDARNGIMAGLISLDVKKADLVASDKEGDRAANALAELNKKVASADLKHLAALEKQMDGSGDVIAHAATPADDIDIGSAIVEADEGKAPAAPGASGAKVGAPALPVDKTKPWMEHTGGGVYNVGAPWLAEPIKVKKEGDKTAKELAEAEVKRLAEEGPPPTE